MTPSFTMSKAHDALPGEEIPTSPSDLHLDADGEVPTRLAIPGRKTRRYCIGQRKVAVKRNALARPDASLGR